MPNIILKDTREKFGWDFDDPMFEVVEQKLDTGDYTIQGYEHLLVIERKKSAAEIAANVYQARFKNELERMLTFKYRFAIFEFNLDDILSFPVGSDIPKAKWDTIKVSPKFVIKYINDMRIKYGIHVIYAGDKHNAQLEALSIMKRVLEHGKKD